MSGGGRASGRAGGSSVRGMAILKGSEKQVEWATQIRTTTNNALNESIAFAKSQTSKMGEARVKAAIDWAEKAKHEINSTTSASELIDTIGSYVGHKTGNDAKSAALLGITRTLQNGTGDLAKRLKKARGL